MTKDNITFNIIETEPTKSFDFRPLLKLGAETSLSKRISCSYDASIGPRDDTRLLLMEFNLMLGYRFIKKTTLK